MSPIAYYQPPNPDKLKQELQSQIKTTELVTSNLTLYMQAIANLLDDGSKPHSARHANEAAIEFGAALSDLLTQGPRSTLEQLTNPTQNLNAYGYPFPNGDGATAESFLEDQIEALHKELERLEEELQRQEEACESMPEGIREATSMALTYPIREAIERTKTIFMKQAETLEKLRSKESEAIIDAAFNAASSDEQKGV